LNLADDALLRHRELTQEVYNIGDEVAQYVENLAEAIADWDAELVEDCLMEIEVILTEARDDSRRVVAELTGVRHALTSGIRSGTVSVRAPWGLHDVEKRTEKPTLITDRTLTEKFPLGETPVIVREFTTALCARTDLVIEHCHHIVEWVLECTALAADDLDVLSLPLLYTQSKQLVESAAYAWLETVARKHPTYVRTMRGSNPPAFLLERARIDAVVAKVAAKRAQAASGRRGGYAS